MQAHWNLIGLLFSHTQSLPLRMWQNLYCTVCTCIPWILAHLSLFVWRLILSYTAPRHPLCHHFVDGSISPNKKFIERSALWLACEAGWACTVLYSVQSAELAFARVRQTLRDWELRYFSGREELYCPLHCVHNIPVSVVRAYLMFGEARPVRSNTT